MWQHPPQCEAIITNETCQPISLHTAKREQKVEDGSRVRACSSSSTGPLLPVCASAGSNRASRTPLLALKSDTYLDLSTGSFRCLALVGFQNPYHGKYCVPAACCRWRTEEFVDLAKIADCLHVAPVNSKDKSILGPDNSYEPLPNFGNYDRKATLAATSFRKDAHKSHNIGAWSLSSKRILHFQLDKIAAVAERNFHFKLQLPTQFSKELGTRPRFSNDKSARSADIHNIIGTQFCCQHAWAERPVTSNVDPSQENNERHSPSTDATITLSGTSAELGRRSGRIVGMRRLTADSIQSRAAA
jgi:hypothetical protein